MMCNSPPRIDNRSFSDFDDAVTCEKAHGACCKNHVKMCPVRAVVVNIISDFAEKEAFRLEDSLCFGCKGLIEEGDVIAALSTSFDADPESAAKVLMAITTLVGDMGRIVDNDVHACGRERHAHIVANDQRAVADINVQPNNAALTSPPKTAMIHGGVKDSFWRLVRVERKHALDELGILPVPN
jgi:hypothetical protein